MVTTVELPVHLSIFPSQEGPLEAPGHEHQRSVWPGHIMAPCTPSFHSHSHQSHFGLGQIPEPSSFMVSHPRSGLQHEGQIQHHRMLRSQDGGLHLCYALRRLATNIQEPYRTLSLQAIDTTITWWTGKPAPRASALRAPCAMSPNLAKILQGALRQWYLQMIEHHVPCHVPAFKTIFVKHSSVVDLLCNHKSAIESWSLAQTPQMGFKVGSAPGLARRGGKLSPLICNV